MAGVFRVSAVAVLRPASARIGRPFRDVRVLFRRPSRGRPAASLGANGGRCPRFCAVLAVSSVLAASVVRTADVIAQYGANQETEWAFNAVTVHCPTFGRPAASVGADGDPNPRPCARGLTSSHSTELTRKPSGRSTPFPFTAKRWAAQRPASARMPTQIRDLAALCRPTLRPAVCKLYLFKKGRQPCKAENVKKP